VNESIELGVLGVVPYTNYTVTIVAKPLSGGYWSQPSTAYEFVSPASGKSSIIRHLTETTSRLLTLTLIKGRLFHRKLIFH